MKTIQLFLVTICVAVAVSHPGGGHDEKFKEKHKKMMECHEQTKALGQCCEFPKPKEEESECKTEHLMGIETKEKKEQGKAFMCFMDCEFKSKGFIEGKEVKWDKIKEYGEAHKEDAPGFDEVGNSALEFCEKTFNEKMEKFKNMKHDKPPKDKEDKDGKDGKHCGFMAVGITGCLGGYVTRNCPDDKWKNTDECNAVKANSTSIEECMA
ncbi:unnamed protein product [Chironomus riparius]|uniref:Uncharacterized protein n=1 Tax=Chironomus riparius TaxID=315576 RepID=A0A9N9WJY9_9DIPT|nr:unnamed protein product [Chironomus riparius]